MLSAVQPKMDALKRPRWESTLVLWAQSRVGQPFAWGRVDCAILCFEAFDRMTGLALAAEYRGRYSTEAQARRFQRRRTDLFRVLKAAGCFEAKPPALVGDILVAAKDGFLCGHVCLGRLAISAEPWSGVGLCESAEAAAVPDAVILRIP